MAAKEFAPGVAEDEATIVGMGPAVVLGKTRNDVIRIRESNPLDGDKGYKLYAPNIGIANDGVLNLVSVR